MYKKLVLTSVLLICQTGTFFAMSPDSKELDKSTTKPKNTMTLLIEKLKKENKPEFSRNCCWSSWKKNTDVFNITTKIEEEFRTNGHSSNDADTLFGLANSRYLCNINYFTNIGLCFSTTSLFLILVKYPNKKNPKEPLDFTDYSLLCGQCTAWSCLLADILLKKDYLAVGKSPYLRTILEESRKNKTCPGKIGMIYSPNTAQDILPYAQDNV